MEAALTYLGTEVDDCIGASNLRRSTTGSAVDSRLDTFMLTLYETCRPILMFLRSYNDRNVESTIAAVHRRLFHHRISVDEVRPTTQLPFVKNLPGSVRRVLLTHTSPPAQGLSIPLFQ